MTVRSLGYALVETRDLDAWRRFATDVVGLMPAAGTTDDQLLLRMDDRPFRICVRRGDRERFIAPGWEFASKAELDDVIRRLEQAGRHVERASPAAARERFVYELARTTDPAGNTMELYYGRMLDYTPFSSPAGVSGFVTGAQGELGLGHVVLNAPNFDETHTFYKSTLGFGDTDLGRFYLAGGADDPGIGFAFLHARNGRHHSLALGEIPPSESLLVHMMLEVGSIDDVGRAHDRAVKAGVPISASLGRHVNDKMFSFYMKTPSGFDIEYGCHGLVIDPETWIPTTSLAVSDWGHVWARQAQG